jgi:hypothetical protein
MRNLCFKSFILGLNAGCFGLLLMIWIMPGCAKKEPPHQYQVTYVFESTHAPYTVQTWTPETQFSQTIASGVFTRTETHGEIPDQGFQARIDAPAAGYKRITISVDGRTTSCTDTIFNTLSCQAR